MAELSGVLASELSRIETGRLLPSDTQIEAIETAYELPLASWYPWDGFRLPVEADSAKRVAA